MADVTTIPPASPQIQPLSAIGQQGNTAELALTGKLASQLSVVSGTIIGKDDNGNFLLKTSAGNLALQSSLPLTYNSDLVIRIDSDTSSHTNTAKIISVNGETVSNENQDPQAGQDSVSDSLLAKASGSGTITLQKLQLALSANTVQAVISEVKPLAQNESETVQGNLSGNTGESISGSNATLTLAPDTEITLHLPQTVIPISDTEGDISLPQPLPATGISPDIKGHGSPLPPPVTSGIPGLQSGQLLPESEAASSEPLQEDTGNRIPASLYSAYTKQGMIYNTQISAIPTLPEHITFARLVSVNKDGTATLETENQEITIKTDSMPELARTSPGTEVAIETSPAPETSLPATSPLPASLPEIASSWNTIKDIIAALQGSDSQPDTILPEDTGIASNAVAGNSATNGMKPAINSVFQNLPVIGENFTLSSLAFIRKLAQGNTRDILGDEVVSSLKKNGRMDLLEKFNSEIDSLSHNAPASANPQASQNPGWQTIFLPFIFNDSLQQARMYVKRDPQNSKDGMDTAGTRFVVEVNLPESGELQLDGLVKKSSANTFFNLVIRSNQAIAVQQQNDISAIYHDIAEQTGFSGTIAFQTTADFPIKPLDEIIRHNNVIVA